MKEIVVGGAPKKQVVAKSEPKIERIRKPSFIGKVISVIVDDIKSFVFHKRLVIGETPEGWEDYQRFVELAKKGMK